MDCTDRNPVATEETTAKCGDIKLPHFLPFNIRLWIRMVDFIFAREGIRNEQAMYTTVKKYLQDKDNSPMDSTQWRRIEILNCSLPYSTLKVALLAKHHANQLKQCPGMQVDKTSSNENKKNKIETKEAAKQKVFELKIEQPKLAEQLAKELQNVSLQ